MLLGCSGTNEGLVQVPDGVFQRPSKLNCVEVAFKRAIQKMGRTLIPGRAGVTTDGVLNKVPVAVPRPRPLRARLQSAVGVSFADGAHLSRARLRQPHDPAVFAGLRSAPRERHQQGAWRARHRCEHARGDGVLGACRGARRRHAREHAHSAQLADRARIPAASGTRQGSSGCYLSEHIMGIRGSGYVPARIGTETTLDDGRPVGPYIPRFRNVTDRHPDFIRGYHFQGGGGCAEFPGMAHDIPGYGKAFKSNVRKHYPALISFGGFGEVLPRKENRITLDPARAGRVGAAGDPLRLPLRRQRAEDGEGHGRHDRRDADRGRRRGHQDRPRAAAARDGRSTRSARRGWATIRRPRSPIGSAACTM